MGRRYTVCVDIHGILRDLKPSVIERPCGPSGIFKDKNNGEAAAFCVIQLAKGRKVLPLPGCGRPCPSGCEGFDYINGCPGIEIKE